MLSEISPERGAGMVSEGAQQSAVFVYMLSVRVCARVKRCSLYCFALALVCVLISCFGVTASVCVCVCESMGGRDRRGL